MEVVFTNGVPLCPYCQKPTRRQEGMSMSTCLAFIPTYDENGINTNPDRNNVTTDYECLGCDKVFSIHGNHIDGYNYVGINNTP